MATVALSALRSKLQTFLKDTSARKWDEDDLDLYINMALTQWTTDVPIKSSTPYTVVSGQHEYDLPENAVGVFSVYGYFESSVTQEWLGPMALRPGAFVDNDEPRRYIIGYPSESQFYLPRVSVGTTFTLYYGAKHSPVVNDTDLINLRMHAWGELAVIYYAAYLAYIPFSAGRARLEQWGRKNDLKVDNPLAEMAEMYKDLYEELLGQHTQPESWEFVPMGRV